MPAGQKRKSNILINKQKRLIASRLMQISLDVDDYLYKQKQFSPQIAASYIREISSYEDKCSGDERSLQVIEKLTRCMKAIIEEQRELQRDGNTGDVVPFQHFTENRQEAASPVYSTADEDLTQTLENVEANEVFKKTQDEMTSINNIASPALDVDDDLTQILDIGDKEDNRNDLNMYTDELNDIIEMIDADREAIGINKGEKDDITKNITEKIQSEIDITKAIYKDPGRNTLVIDISDDDIDPMTIKNAEKPTLKSNIETGISSLSIIDFEASQSATPLLQDSQSILENCNDDQLRYLDIPLTQVEALKPAVTRKPENNITSIIRDATKNVFRTKLKVNPQKFTVTSGIAQIQNESQGTADGKILKPINKKAANEKNKRKPKAKKANPKNKNNHTELSKIKNTAKNNYKTGIVVNTVLTTEHHAEREINMQHTHKFNKCNTQYNCMQESNAKYQGTQSKVPEIYSTNVVQDLSWIQDIRYVREVCTEEYETCTVDEFFWENCTLPSKLNEDDFN